MAKNDRWSKEQSSASSSYRTLPMWMLQIEKKGREATTLKKNAPQVEEARKENSKQSDEALTKTVE